MTTPSLSRRTLARDFSVRGNSATPKLRELKRWGCHLQSLSAASRRSDFLCGYPDGLAEPQFVVASVSDRLVGTRCSHQLGR